MRVPGIIYASEKLMRAMGQDESPRQVANVAHLPGIVKRSLAMPDMHWGYGFPIGGVAAFELEGGVVSPGGVGYDINCGCRLMVTNLRHEEVRPQIAKIVTALFQHVPSGVGSKGALKLPRSEEKKVLAEGARWAVTLVNEGGRPTIAEARDAEPPSDLKSAVLFGALYAAVLFAVSFARERLGSGGLYAVAALSGLTDMHCQPDSNITPSAISQWGENVPKAREWQLRAIRPEWFKAQAKQAA